MSGLATRTLERVRRVLERLPPDALELLAQAAIERLDALEGDPDAEDDDPQGDIHHDGEGEPSEWADIGGDLCRAADSNAPRLAAGFHL